jgi:hypothetical protein
MLNHEFCGTSVEIDAMGLKLTSWNCHEKSLCKLASVSVFLLMHTVCIAVTTFWVALTFILLFAYPTPEFPTPSFEYHTAFNGVTLGIVS